MRVGDLVKRKRKDWTALVIKTFCAPPPDLIKSSAPGPVRYVEIMWCKSGEIDSCSASLLEVINNE